MSYNNKSFYLTLPSNSSINIFPSNTLANYTTQLCKGLRVCGDIDWEIALVEINYPAQFSTNTKIPKVAKSWVSYTFFGDNSDTTSESIPISKVAFSVETNEYRNVHSLVKILNSELIAATENLPEDAKHPFRISYLVNLNRIKVDAINNSNGFNMANVCVSSYLAIQMGFLPPIKNIKNSKSYGLNEIITNLITDNKQLESLAKATGEEIEILKSPDTYAVADYPPFLDVTDIPTHMYVYCDLVEPNFVGDSVVPLLRIVHIDDNNHNKNVSETYDNAHYVPLLKRAFDTVEIDIRDDRGYKIPFAPGKLCVKLHIRP